ncbi:MAG: cellulase family glycosylhydrolase [Deltaproteobacteria bacterium]|nr:cellulase family glycosylhydrolase [Deltaproteobacteria bacterium]
MHRSWRRRALALLTLAAVLAPALAVAAPKALRQAGRWLVDADGRAVILHGVNQVNKLPPYLPSAIGFGADDIAKIAAEGFNTVRFGLAHQGLAPAPGVYDAAYLDDIAATVSLMTAEGIYVLLDFHQDLYGERYQGNGMADWATVDSSPTDPTLLPACDHGFPGNIFSCPFLWEAFDRFFGLNGRELEIGPRGRTLQAEFADAWRQVAARFKDEPLVFGYNLMNEPYPGSSIPQCLRATGCPGNADAQLTAFSNLVAEAIREVDPATIVYYEPYGTNFNAGFPTHHGDVDVDGVGFSFHVYACLPDAGPSATCGPRERTVFLNADAQAETFAHAPLVTEFGATDQLETIERIVAAADEHRMGWQYWAWWNRDPCCESPGDGVIDHPMNPPTSEHLKEDKLDVLVRPYPRAVAGTPLDWSFDRVTRRFTMSYATTPVDGALAPGAVTEVWIPGRHFPGGYDVVGLSGAQVVSIGNAERLQLLALPGATTVSFSVVPAGCGPVPAPGCAQQLTADRGALAMTDATPDAKDRLRWSWIDGAAATTPDFGNPSASTAYRLCVWDETAGVPRLVGSLGVPVGGTCDGKPCWRATSTGFRYRDPGAASDGIRQIVLKAGAAGRSNIQVRGQGSALALPPLPFAQASKVTVQLRNDSSPSCWEATYSAPARRNEADQFKDRGD